MSKPLRKGVILPARTRSGTQQEHHCAYMSFRPTEGSGEISSGGLNLQFVRNIICPETILILHSAFLIVEEASTLKADLSALQRW